MIKTLFVLSLSIGVGSAIASPPKRNVLEKFVVKDLRQSGNLMPGPARPHPIRTTFVLDAVSNGCTKPGDFAVHVKWDGDFQEMTIERTKADTCKGRAQVKPFDMETEGLIPSSSKPIRVLNPLLVEEHFVH